MIIMAFVLNRVLVYLFNLILTFILKPRHLREVEYYTNATADARPKKLIQQKRQFSKWQQCRGSCLCFVGRKFVIDDEDEEKENQGNMHNVR